MRKRPWLIGLGVFVVVVLGLKLLLLDTSASPAGTYVIDVEALHKAAGEGDLPTRIEVERIADFAFPRTFGVAGDGFHMQPMILLAHRVLYPDGHAVIIDTGLSAQDAEPLPGADFHIDAYNRMESALLGADRVLFTHEHVDHVGGIASAPRFDQVVDKVLITKEQLEGPRLERDKWAAGTLEKLKPTTYDGLYKVAPGIVLQKAPGHSTGSQLVYVELADGTRYLFVGDIAWSEDNITLQRGRPALATLLIKEDRAAVASQLEALAKVPKDVHIVVAHDPHAYTRDLQAGLFHDGFTAP